MKTKNNEDSRASARRMSNLESQAVKTDQIKGGQGKLRTPTTKPRPDDDFPSATSSLQKESTFKK